MGNFFRKYVLKNLPFKVVSLALAILLWWAVGRGQPHRSAHDGSRGIFRATRAG